MTAQQLIPRKCDGFLMEQMEGEMLLYHPARNIIIHSNDTAALVWQLCDGLNSVDDIVNILSGAYPESRAQIAKDVPDTIQQLRAQGALDGG